MTVRARLIPLVVPALRALRERRRAAVVVTLLGALAMGLLIPAGSLRRGGAASSPAILLPDLPAAGPALMWTAEAQTPSATQTRAIGELLKLVLGFAWVGFGVAAFSIFSGSAAQARGRAAEIGVRRAVGASLRNSVLSLLFEAAVLALIALVIGVALGGLLRSMALHWWPGLAAAARSAGPVPALALCAMLGAASLIPLWHVRSRHLVEPGDEQVGLKIPAAQVAISIALLLASAALLGAGRRDAPGDAAVSPEAGEVFQVDSGSEAATVRGARLAVLLERVSGKPGVTLASLSSPGALIGIGTVDEVTTDCGRCVFGQIYIRWPHFPALAHAVSPDTFRAGPIRLLEGRLLTAADSSAGARVAVVNRNLALRYFEAGQAVGRNLYLGPGWPTVPYRVVGIVADQRAAALGGTLQPRETVYLSVLQHAPRRVELLLRSSAGASARGELAAELGALLGATATVEAAADETSYRGIQSRAIRWFGAAFGVTAALVLLMALVGTFFATRVWLASVTWELGLRRAVGARRRHLAGFVVRRTLALAGAGAALGCFLYASVLLPALSAALVAGSPAPLLLARVAVLPVLLAVTAGILPGVKLLRAAPIALLR